MKDKIFLRIEKGGTNRDYYSHVVQLVETLGLDPNKAILFAIVYTNKHIKEQETNGRTKNTQGL